MLRANIKLRHIKRAAEKLKYKFGIIAIDSKGNISVSKTTEMIYYALDNGNKIDLFSI